MKAGKDTYIQQSIQPLFHTLTETRYTDRETDIQLVRHKDTDRQTEGWSGAGKNKLQKYKQIH